MRLLHRSVALACLLAVGYPLPAADAPAPPDDWAFKPVARPALPQSALRNPIDRFLLAKLEAKGLTFAPPADKRTLLRRVYVDLIGLPPTPEEVEAFV